MGRALIQSYLTSRPSTQYDSWNAFNVNNDGNVNANNKYNELTVVPFAELIETMIHIESRYKIPLGSIWDAYYDCMQNKHGSLHAMMFELNAEESIRSLWREINSGQYAIGKSIAFIVEQPVKREVFAAGFRDRVIHHWVCMRLLPLFEEYLSPRMYSNRKGKGTLAAVKSVCQDIEEVSNNYSRDCWIWKFDLKGFFMSIDKRLLNDKLQSFIDERYHEKDKETLKWLVDMIVSHCPQEYCVMKSDKSAWVGLNKDKSLFTQDKNHGLAIGNLTSQIFANFFLMEMMEFLAENGFHHTTQYVDDVVLVHRDKGEILAFIPKFRIWLKEHLGITLHPKKCYIQHYTKGVSFVGGIVKPYRMYISKRTRRRLLGKIHYITKKVDVPVGKALETVNSYFGLTRHFSEYMLRLQVAAELFGKYRHSIMFNNNCEKMIINNAYAPCQ